jgi:hypothetical protein
VTHSPDQVAALRDALDGLWVTEAGTDHAVRLDNILGRLDRAGLLAPVPRPYTCPGGLPDGWRTDFDPDCPRHGTPPATDDELRALLPAARAALGWAVGARTGVYHDDPAKTDRDGMLVNVIVAVLDEMRTPAEVKELRSGG